MSGGDKLAVLQRGRQSIADAAGQSEWTSKKWIWVRDEAAGFVAANMVEENGDVVNVKLQNGSVVDFNINDTYRMNPPKFDKVEDLADLAYLNEPAVLENLRMRYHSNLIYTYSGLFCVVVNPYKRLPIYTAEIINAYKGMRRQELPPHVYSIADTAYRDMIQDRENQSILITGESGAGKTENTKRVIQYLATIAAGSGMGRDTLEQQLLQCNPVLEAFGNAKTVKNDNSSRFGKFIRIEFDRSGCIVGGNIETYLLESSRAVSQGPKERNYHIFYQLLKSATLEDRANYLLDDLEKVPFISNPDASNVDTIDDREEFKNTCNAMTVVGITEDEQRAIFTILGGIMQWGQVEFQDDRSEQAQIVNDSKAAMVCRLFGVHLSDLTRAMLKPRMKVGRDYVTKAQRSDQVVAAVKAICKAIYQRLFLWVVEKVNRALDTRRSSSTVIGILDIAGFEIFKVNSFEQLCINYTNEKLQQLFNNHMFVYEQDEYRREGIDWTFIDFGLDLQPCIDLLEKPMGVLSLLDDECLLLPRSSDQTYADKLAAQHDGRTPKFQKLKGKIRRDVPGFIVEHYASPVEYTVDGWLIKNTDPLNDNITEVLSKSNDRLMHTLFKDMCDGSRIGGRRMGSMRTVCQLYRDHLASLMTTLRATSPHFIRCIIPNLEKKPGKIDPHLVLDQLRCNGVLEGIRICRKGFPNRVCFQDFKQRYELLVPGAVPRAFMDGRRACEKILEALQVQEDNYRIGMSKVFFRAGVIGQLEEMRDEKLSSVICNFQAFCRGSLARKAHRRLTNHEVAIKIIQRNCSKYLMLRTWHWWKLFVRVQPLLKVTQEDSLKHELEDTKKRLEDHVRTQEELVQECEALTGERRDLRAELDQRQEELFSTNATIERLQTRMEQLLKGVEDLEAKVEDGSARAETLLAEKMEVMTEKGALETELRGMQDYVDRLQLEKSSLEEKLRATQAQLDVDQDSNQKLTKENAYLGGQLAAAREDLAATEDKLRALQKAKLRVDGLLEETEARLQAIEKDRADQAAGRRRLEAELVAAREQIEAKEKWAADLEIELANKAAGLDQLHASLGVEQQRAAKAERERQDLVSQMEFVKEELEAEQLTVSTLRRANADMDQTAKRLEAAIEDNANAGAVQADMRARREAELADLQRKYLELSDLSEQNATEAKKRFQRLLEAKDTEIDVLTKAKTDLERQTAQLKAELEHATVRLEAESKARADLDRKKRAVDAQLADTQSRVQEMERGATDLRERTRQLQSTVDVLNKKYDEKDMECTNARRDNKSLQARMDEVVSMFDEETRQKLALQAKLKSTEQGMDEMCGQLAVRDSEKEAADHTVAMLKAQVDDLRAKLEAECDSLEESKQAKKKMQRDMSALNDQLAATETARNKLASTNVRLQADLDDLMNELNTAHNDVQQAAKRVRKAESLASEHKAMVDQAAAERQAAQAEASRLASEVYGLKGHMEEMEELVAQLKKDNQNLKIEIEELQGSSNRDASYVANLEKSKRSLEATMGELKTEMEELEDELQNCEDAKVRLEVAMQALRQQMERDLAEKDEKGEEARRGLQRQLRDLEEQLEEERRLKTGLATKLKKAEADLTDSQALLEDAERQREEASRQCKKTQQVARESQNAADDVHAQLSSMHMRLREVEKKWSRAMMENAQLTADLERSEKSRKALDLAYNDMASEADAYRTQTVSLQDARHRQDMEMAALNEEKEDALADLEDMTERERKANLEVDALRHAEATQKDHICHLESKVQHLENQCKELRGQADQALVNGEKQLKARLVPLEQKAASLMGDLDLEIRKGNDLSNKLRRLDRKYREAQRQLEDAEKLAADHKASGDRMLLRLRSLSQQNKELEHEATTLHARNRRLQAEVNEATEKVELLTTQLQTTQSRARRIGRAHRTKLEDEVEEDDAAD